MKLSEENCHSTYCILSCNFIVVCTGCHFELSFFCVGYSQILRITVLISYLPHNCTHVNKSKVEMSEPLIMTWPVSFRLAFPQSWFLLSYRVKWMKKL